jgi:hypothetical protein
MSYYVYFHSDPVTHEVRYIGKGTGRRAWALAKRYGHHKSWLQSLAAQGLKPIITVVQEFETDDEAMAREVELIAEHRSRGAKLCNIADGGTSGPRLLGSLHPRFGYRATPEERERMSKQRRGRRHSEETKAKIWAGLLSSSKDWKPGRKLSPEHKAKIVRKPRL